MPVAPDMVDTVQNFDIEDLLEASSGGSGGNNTIRINGTAEIVSRRELVHVDMADSYEIPVTDGYIRFGHYETVGPAYTTQEIQRVTQDAVDSNTSIIKRSTIKQPYNTSVDPDTGKLTVSGQPKSGMLSADAAYYINTINQAQMAASVGISLGKGFDSYLYNANPDYWDSIGMQTMNPETWSSITAGQTGLGATLFNAIFGIDPTSGKAQMYVDSTAFAYMSQYLYEKGAFNTGTVEYEPATFPTTGNIHVDSLTNPALIYTYLIDKWINYANILGCTVTYSEPLASKQISLDVLMSELTDYANNVLVFNGSFPNAGTPPYYSLRAMRIYTSSATVGYDIPYNRSTSAYTPTHTYDINVTWDYANRSLSIRIFRDIDAGGSEHIRNTAYDYMSTYDGITYLNNINGTYVEYPATEGITTQANAQLPTGMENWTDPNATDASLRQQYPDLYANAITYDVPDAQGNLIEKTYVPVAWPTTTANPWTDVQPTTDTSVQTQTQTMVDLLEAIQAQTGTLAKTLADTLTKTITQPVNTTPTGTVPPSENPTNTGSGSSPVPVSTSGSSSKLWSVYHPTQGQVDAFGAWLWSTNFIDQIMKMFQNPMEGIISLHKVFATPIDAGTGNIVVGTLDSGVASATVTQQYVYVSCGSVDCHEDFGNVFDYSPHTQVSLYLPFIGIVPLDVSDVMRSTISIEYGVDMFTGACLAMVKVSRDNATVNMYQYAGSASVEYPLSNVQQSQLLSGILAVAAGGAAIATGGMSIPAGAAVAGGVANTLKSNVGRSGGFSGNAGAMGIKKPYLIIQRPQTKVASLFPRLAGYPTNISGQLSDFSGQVKVTDVHVEGIPATDVELTQIEELLHSGVLV